MTTVYRVRAILNINRESTSSVLNRTYAVSNGMGSDPGLYSDPVPSLPILAAQSGKVEVAQKRVGTRVLGAAQARDFERRVLVSMLETERSYVQSICDANVDQAATIVVKAGMVVATIPAHDDPLLKVTCGFPPGTVHLDAKAAALAGKSGRRVFYTWQWTTDGGLTFYDAPPTVVAKTTIEGLTPLTMVGFRVSVTNVKGPRDWSQIVTILVQ